MQHHILKAANSTPRLQQNFICVLQKDIEYMSGTLNSIFSIFIILTINISKVKHYLLLIAMHFLSSYRIFSDVQHQMYNAHNYSKQAILQRHLQKPTNSIYAEDYGDLKITPT